MGFAYCDFRHQGASQMLMARSVARPRSLHRRTEPSRSADARAEVTARVETPAVESAKLEPVKSEPKAEAARSEPAKAESAPGTAPLDRLIAHDAQRGLAAIWRNRVLHRVERNANP